MPVESRESRVEIGNGNGHGVTLPGGQLVLLEAESDEALLLSSEEATKRYTARTAAKLEERRDPILALIGCGLPVDYVAYVCHCSARIVRLLGAKYATLASRSTNEMCKVLGGLAMKAAFHIDQKLDQAKVSELAVVMGIALQRKQEMEALTNSAAETALDVEQVNEKAEAARKWLTQRAESRKQKAEIEVEEVKG